MFLLCFRCSSCIIRVFFGVIGEFLWGEIVYDFFDDEFSFYDYISLVWIEIGIFWYFFVNLCDG